MGKIGRGLLGGQVKVGKDDDAGDRVLDDLCSPAGVCAGMEAFTQLEPEIGRASCRERVLMPV